MSEVETLSAKEAAIQLGTDARNFRKFMRSITPKDDQPGQGNRYAIEADEVPDLKRKFEQWKSPSKNGAKPKAQSKQDLEDAVDIDLEMADDEELEDLMISDDEDLMDEELDDLVDEDD